MQKLFIKVNVIFMALFLIIACDDTNPPNAHSDDPQIVGNESIAQELAQDYNGNDITFTFNNGVTLSILSNDNKGASNGKVTLKHIQNENYFNSVNDIVIDFADVKSNYTFTLEHTLKPNLVKGDITVFKYTPDRAKDKLNAQIVNFDYDAASGKINAKITGLGAISSGKMPVLQDGNNSRLIISWADRYKLSDGDEQVVMQVPYYEQPGGSCWATCAQMLTKAYPRDDDEYSNRLGVIDFIKYLKHTSLDEGIGLWDFKMNLPNAINLYSSTKTEVSTFVSSSNMLEEIINKLRENKPLIMNLTYPGVGRHAIMIIGYKRELISIAKINVKLLIHNPQNVGTESMYKWVDWEWLMKEKWPQEAYQILYPKDPLSKPNLVTMGMPINKQLGDLNFMVGNNTQNYKISLQYNLNTPEGYEWVFPNTVVCNTIPDTVTNLNFNIPIYNSDNQSKNVKLILKIKNNKSNKVEIEESMNYVAKPGTSKLTSNIFKIRSIIGKETFDGTLSFELLSNGKYIDGYKLKFKIAPSISKIVDLTFFDLKTTRGDLDIDILCSNTIVKGTGLKYSGSFEGNKNIDSDWREEWKGNITIEFDKEINPTLIKKVIIDKTINIYFEDELDGNRVQKVVLSNIEIDVKEKFPFPISIRGYKVCDYIESFSLKYTNYKYNGCNYEIEKVSCDNLSTLLIEIK